MRVATADDHAAFLADAEHAVATGAFPEQLTSPLVQLTDVCCLGAGECAGGARLYVTANGTVRRCIGSEVAELDRPAWIPRFFAALFAVRGLRDSAGRPARVSGFGWRLVPGLEPAMIEAPEAPLLVARDAEHLLLVGEDVYRLGLDAARLLELLLVSGSVDAAGERAEALLGLPATQAWAALRRLREAGFDLPDLAVA